MKGGKKTIHVWFIFLILTCITIIMTILGQFYRSWMSYSGKYNGNNVNSPTVVMTEGEAKDNIVEEPLTGEDLYMSYVDDICKTYDNVDPCIIKSVIYQESRYQPDVSNGEHIGLMQISTRWHKDRADKLGVTDFFDPYSNILLGVDIFSELMDEFEDPAVCLMVYNSGYSVAFQNRDNGTLTQYAKEVLERSKEYA